MIINNQIITLITLITVIDDCHLLARLLLLLLERRRVAVRRRLRVRLEAQLWHVEVLVERDEARRGEGEAEEVAEREPVPKIVKELLV